MLTTAPPITVSGMDLTFRRDMPGFRAARNFVLEPLGGGGSGMFAHLRCTDTVYVQRDQAHRQPHPLGDPAGDPLARL